MELPQKTVEKARSTDRMDLYGHAAMVVCSIAIGSFLMYMSVSKVRRAATMSTATFLVVAPFGLFLGLGGLVGVLMPVYKVVEWVPTEGERSEDALRGAAERLAAAITLVFVGVVLVGLLPKAAFERLKRRLG